MVIIGKNTIRNTRNHPSSTLKPLTGVARELKWSLKVEKSWIFDFWAGKNCSYRPPVTWPSKTKTTTGKRSTESTRTSHPTHHKGTTKQNSGTGATMTTIKTGRKHHKSCLKGQNKVFLGPESKQGASRQSPESSNNHHKGTADLKRDPDPKLAQNPKIPNHPKTLFIPKIDYLSEKHA